MTDSESDRHALSPRRELANAMGASAISRSLAMVAALSINAVVARFLPSMDYAFVGVLIAVSAIVVVVLQLGYQTSIVRVAGAAIYENDWSRLSAGLLAGTLAIFATTVIAAPLLYLAVPRVFPVPSTGEFDAVLIGLSIAQVALVALNIFYAEALRGAGKVASATTLSGSGQHGGVARGLLILVIAVPLALAGLLSLRIVLLIGIAASCMTALISLRMLARQCLIRPRLQSAWQQFRGDFSQNMTIMSGEFLLLVGGLHLATLIGSTILAGETVALFVAAMQMSNVVGAPLLLFNGSSPKLLILAHRKGEKAELEALLRLGASMAFVFTTGACFAIFVMGEFFFGLIFGEKYAASATIFSFFIPGLLFSAFGGSAARLLLLVGFEGQYLLFSVASAILVPLTYFVAVTYFGVLGLAASISIVFLVQNIFLLMVARKYVGVWACAYIKPADYLRIFKEARDGLLTRFRRS